MKKLLYLTIFLLAFGLTACSDEQDVNSTATNSKIQNVTPDDGTADSNPTETESGTGDSETKPYLAVNGKNLFLRLIGKFESAMLGQKNYDGISGASGGVQSNQNSDVHLQYQLSEETDPAKLTQDAWKNYTYNIEEFRVDTAKSKINLDANSGMSGNFSDIKGQLTLAGTPNKAGKYPISMEIAIENNGSLTTNALIFKIYGLDERLIDRMQYSNMKKMQDNKYLWDMEPWEIGKFGGDNESVTVLPKLKGWFGSHTSGTYGFLGYAVEDEIPTQTLIIPEGTDLTLVNMQILSSVKIIVKNGATLRLHDSSIHCKVEVEGGGTLSVNYDQQNKKFTKGSLINGQIILNQGAILENAAIHSASNYLPNGKTARHNVEPVVLAKGDITIKGKVFIMGDEAPTGTDPNTGRAYTGQPAFKIKDGSVNITKDSVLATYGGGFSGLTSIGATATILENGNISGEGKFIAIGGDGFTLEGGDAVSGTGNINVKQAFINGGDNHNTKNPAGKAQAKNVSITTEQKYIADGEQGASTGDPKPIKWRPSLSNTPDLSQYPIDNTQNPVSKKQNEWTNFIELQGWTEGEPANTPTASAKFGEVIFEYSNKLNGVYDKNIPTVAGTYYVRASVAETAEYTGLTGENALTLQFTIAENAGNTGSDKKTPPNFEFVNLGYGYITISYGFGKQEYTNNINAISITRNEVTTNLNKSTESYMQTDGFYINDIDAQLKIKFDFAVDDEIVIDNNLYEQVIYKVKNISFSSITLKKIN